MENSSKKLTIAINGFGRIGRTVARVLLDNQVRDRITIGAIASPDMTPEQGSYLFAHDSVMGNWPGTVTYTEKEIIIDGIKIPFIGVKNTIPDWGKYQISWVIDASGAYTEGARAREHISVGGAQGVIITAPAHNEDITIILGVNNNQYIPEKHTIISLGSCTTNAYAPVIDIIDRAYTITHSFMTTVHAYTNSQVLLDSARHDMRESRAAGLNIIPTGTGASKVMTKIFPHLNGRIYASSVRVPVPKVSFLDCIFLVKKTGLIPDSCNKLFIEAATERYKNILSVAQFPGVSSDFSGNPHSIIIDSELTHVQENNIKIMGWYDNEWGYSCRVRDFLINFAYSTYST